MPRRLLSKIKSKIVEGERRDFSKNKVFQDLALPRRLLSKIKSKIAKAEAVVNKECSSSYLVRPRRLRSKTKQREKSGAVENKKILFPVIRWLNISADPMKQ